MPPANEIKDSTDWTPFQNHVEFESAEFLFKRCKMSGSNVDGLMELWAASAALHGIDVSPFSDHNEMYSKIDAISVGGVPWQSISLLYDGLQPAKKAPSWMTAEHTIWFRNPCLLFKNMLENPDFAESFDCALLHQYDANDDCCYENFMSSDWAWKQAVSKYLFFASLLI